MGERPFSPEGSGMRATVRGCRLPDWKLEHGWAGEIAPGLQSSLGCEGDAMRFCQRSERI